MQINHKTLIGHYETFLKQYHHLIREQEQKECRLIDHMTKFESPPKTIQHSFHPIQLYEYIKRQGGTIHMNSWAETAREIGFAKSGNIGRRLKDWALQHHIIEFIDYLMGNFDGVINLEHPAKQTLKKNDKDELKIDDSKIVDLSKNHLVVDLTQLKRKFEENDELSISPISPTLQPLEPWNSIHELYKETKVESDESIGGRLCQLEATMRQVKNLLTVEKDEEITKLKLLLQQKDQAIYTMQQQIDQQKRQLDKAREARKELFKLIDDLPI